MYVPIESKKNNKYVISECNLLSVEDEAPPDDYDVVIVETSTTTATPTKNPATTRKTTTTVKPSSNEFIPIDVEPQASCSEQFSAHPADCNKYYLCNNGQPLEQTWY